MRVHIVVIDITGHDVTAALDAWGDVWMVVGTTTPGESFDTALELVAPGCRLLEVDWCVVDGRSGRVVDRAS